MGIVGQAKKKGDKNTKGRKEIKKEGRKKKERGRKVVIKKSYLTTPFI